jgi:ketosteroid isomerase-like protein
MTERNGFERLLRELYAARLRSDLPALCSMFGEDAQLRIAGGGGMGPVVVTASGIGEFRPLLGLLIKSFRLSNQTILSLIIEGEKAAVHWRANVQSRISGTLTTTELVDLVEIKSGRIASYTEFFAPGS